MYAIQKNQRPYTYVGLGGVKNGRMVIWWGLAVWVVTHTKLSHIKLSTLIFHSVVLPNHEVKFHQQFIGDVIYSLAMLYDVP